MPKDLHLAGDISPLMVGAFDGSYLAYCDPAPVGAGGACRPCETCICYLINLNFSESVPKFILVLQSADGHV